MLFSHQHPPSTARVVSLDLDLREEPSNAVASDAVERAARALESERLFVKIDSTLRGPVAGMVRGALAGSHKSVAVIAPAFPEQGRTYAGGRLVVRGEPGPSLVDTLGMERTALLSTTENVELSVEHARMRGAVRVLLDVETPRELARIAAAWQRHPEWLLVGSAGLTRHITHASTPPKLSFATRDPVVIVAGSPAQATHIQLTRLPPVPDVVVLRTTSAPAEQRDSGESAARLADELLAVAGSLRPRVVVLVGGATARAVCHRLDVRAVRLAGELSPGVPAGYLEGGRWDGVAVVTKAGGFGAPDALLDVVRALGVSIQGESHEHYDQ